MSLPLYPDPLREVFYRMPVADILRQCRSNRQIYRDVCQNEQFWKTLARRKGMPEERISDLDLPKLKRILYLKDLRPKIIDLTDLAYRNPATASRQPHDNRYLEYVSLPPSLMGSYVELLLDDLVAKYSGWYATNSENILSPTDYAKRIHDLRLNTFDILKYNNKLYLVEDDPDNEVKMLSLIYHDLDGHTIDSLQLMNRIYEINDEQPLTEQMFRDYYGSGGPTVTYLRFFNYPMNEYFLGDERDPVREQDGVRFHVGNP